MRNYKRKDSKRKMIDAIIALIHQNKVVPSIDTLMITMSIGRTTAYNLLREILATSSLEGIPYENSNLPLPTVFTSKNAICKKKTEADVSGSGGKIKSSPDDQGL